LYTSLIRIVIVSEAFNQVVIIEVRVAFRKTCTGIRCLICKVVLVEGSISTVWNSHAIATTHSEIVRIDTSAVGAELVKVLLSYVEALLPASYESLIVVGREELIFGLVFDEWAGRTRTSHVRSWPKAYEGI
jgi:hypothetical protein